ncbi:MAG TPA: alcohol dehydrogenase catalytic domain-containing protein [Bacteroidales bacterium]|nr:alcohol dehydrogenase catalytic domain-containing protein [Bacteroidales bacterium]
MKTRAAVVYETNKGFTIEELELEAPKEKELLVKVMVAGICHSDWNFVTGDSIFNMPVVLGHEGSGIVLKTGPNVTKYEKGDKVLFNSAPNCGSCFICTHNHPSICETYNEPTWNGVMFDGTTRFRNAKGEEIYQLSSVGCFAEHIVLPEDCAVPLKESIPFDVGAILGCAVTTGMGAVLNTANVRERSNILVFGIGGVGSNVMLGLKMRKANRIIAVDKNRKKGDVAKKLGATDFFEFSEDNIPKIIELSKELKIDYVFEAAGDTGSQELSIICLRPGGTASFIGIPPVSSQTKFNAAAVTRQEKTIKGCYYGTNNTVEDLMYYEQLYLTKELDLDSLISNTYRLDEINEAYANLLKGEHLRGVIVFDA